MPNLFDQFDPAPVAMAQPQANVFDQFDGNAFDRFDGPDLMENILHPPVFAESTGGGTLDFPGDLSKAKFPPHQWTPQEIAQEAKDEATVDAEARPGLIDTLPRAVVADTAAGIMSAFDRGNRAQDAEMFSGNIPAAFEGNPLPIDQIIKQESSDKDEIPAVTAAKISTGIANSAPLLATGFPGLPAWAGRLMALGFSAQMIANAGPAARTLGTELGKNPEDRDNDKISSAVSDLVQDFGFAPFAGLHGVAGSIPVVREAYEKHFDPPMYVIRQLSDQLQNAPIVRPFTDSIEGATLAPNAEENLPVQAGAAKQRAQAPVSGKLDNLAAALQDLQDMLRGKLPAQEQQTVNVPADRADEIIRNVFPAEEGPVEATDETSTDGTSQPAQDSATPSVPVVSDIFQPRSEAQFAESTPQIKPSQSTEQLAQKLESLKTGIGNGGQLHAFGVAADLWDRAITVGQDLIRAGGTIGDAIDATIRYIKDNFKEAFDERGARAALARPFVLSGNAQPKPERAIKVSAPGQARPATTGPPREWGKYDLRKVPVGSDPIALWRSFPKSETSVTPQDLPKTSDGLRLWAKNQLAKLPNTVRSPWGKEVVLHQTRDVGPRVNQYIAGRAGVRPSQDRAEMLPMMAHTVQNAWPTRRRLKVDERRTCTDTPTVEYIPCWWIRRTALWSASLSRCNIRATQAG
jgi:hypothetical protein